MHPSWKPRGLEWAHLAPGVKWLCKPLTGEIQAEVNERVARLIAGLQQGRADLDALGFEDDDLGVLADLNVLAGLSVFAAAVFTAEKIVADWEGIDDAETGEKVAVSPEAIRAALRVGAPECGSALLGPFMAWLNKPRIPIAGDLRRLRALARWEHVGGLEHCRGCDLASADCVRGGSDAGERCPRAINAPQTAPGMAAHAASRLPGVWIRAGIGGQLTGLDYAAALGAVQADGVMDEGAFMRCLAAIEAGALEAAAERSKETS